MNRRREIAAAPVRSAAEAWKVACTLIIDTLERSPSIPAGSVAQALAPLNGLGQALIAGGHLESRGLVLVDSGLHLTIIVMTGDAALAVEENLNPAPGGSSATTNWKLYVPAHGPHNASVVAVIKGSKHLSADEPPNAAPARKEADERPIDLSALKTLK